MIIFWITLAIGVALILINEVVRYFANKKKYWKDYNNSALTMAEEMYEDDDDWEEPLYSHQSDVVAERRYEWLQSDTMSHIAVYIKVDLGYPQWWIYNVEIPKRLLDPKRHLQRMEYLKSHPNLKDKYFLLQEHFIMRKSECNHTPMAYMDSKQVYGVKCSKCHKILSSKDSI